MNTHYKKRYDKFINFIKSKQDRVLDCYTERHHIIPRCIGGSDEPDNLIRLTLREHFLAHWLLWKAYPKSWKLASAFLQMNNKNPQLAHIKGQQGRITSKTYASLKTAVYNKLSNLRKNKVYIKDCDGNSIILTKQEYAQQEEYKFHTTGKVYVFDKIENKSVYISTQDYHNNKQRYEHQNAKKAIYNFIDSSTKNQVKMTKLDAAKLNSTEKYKRYKQIQNKKIPCIDNSENLIYMTPEEYQSRKDTKHLHSGKLSVFDAEERLYKQITLQEYYKTPQRYQTSTKGKVLARDKDNNTVLIDKSDFETGEYVGVTKGLRTVKNSITGEYEQITEEEYQNNKSQYVGPNQGKVNVIDKITGERKQIPKKDFDKDRYSGLGNKMYLFKCKNRLTGKEKNINIYEWHLVKKDYDIIDMDKFQKALENK